MTAQWQDATSGHELRIEDDLEACILNMGGSFNWSIGRREDGRTLFIRGGSCFDREEARRAANNAITEHRAMLAEIQAMDL